MGCRLAISSTSLFLSAMCEGERKEKGCKNGKNWEMEGGVEMGKKGREREEMKGETGRKGESERGRGWMDVGRESAKDHFSPK